jgi:hypothetical protein
MKRTGCILLVLAAASCGRGDHRNPGYAGTLDSLGIPHRTLTERMKHTPAAELPKDGATNGLTVRRVTGPSAGLPRSAAPGARFVTMDAVRKMDVVRQQTGLFIVGTEYVPRELPDILKSRQLTLRPDGSVVDANGEPVVLFVTNELYAASGAEQPQRTSLLGRIGDALVPSAYAASPFPWRCFSFSPWALYHNGWHRWYEASTNIAAYGFDGAGQCSGTSPLTKIDFLRAGAEVGSPGDTHHCFTCAVESAYDTWDVGYFWPAHGTPATLHTGVWADGKFTFSRSASLSW